MSSLAFTYPVREIASAFQGLGLICTAWRIYFRIRIWRFWWEDAWAVLAFFACVAAVAGEWMYLLAHGVPAIAGFWLNTIGSTSVVRGVHMSILFSIIRIGCATPFLHKVTHHCVVLFAVFWAILIVGKIWQCAPDPDWHHNDPPTCIVIEQTQIFEFISDCIAIGMLVALPLCFLLNIKLPRRQRRMILSIFASSIVLAFAAIFHIVGHIKGDELLATAGNNFEIALSIIVCNLLVIVTFVYRFLLHGNSTSASQDSSTETDDFTHPRRTIERTALTMTSIEMEELTTTYHYTDTSLQSSRAASRIPRQA